MKGIGMHPESICCFLCSLQSNADAGRVISFFFYFCFVLTSPSLFSWRLENAAAAPRRFAHNLVLFLQSLSVFELQTDTWFHTELISTFGSVFLSSVFPLLLYFAEMIPGNDAVKLYSNILCLITLCLSLMS